VFSVVTDEEVARRLIAVLRRSPSVSDVRRGSAEDSFRALSGSGAATLQALLKQLENAQRERVDRLRKLEPLLTAGGDVGRGRRLFFGEKAACAVATHRNGGGR